MTPLREAAEKAGIVKPLVWRSVSDRADEADTPFGEYQVAYYTEQGEGSGWSAVFRDNEEIGEYPTSLIAMTACQSHLDAAILSALNPDFLSELDTARKEVERLRKALTDIAGMTDPDDPESYRSDDREGCLDAVQSLAARTLSPDTTEGGPDHG